MVKFHEGLSDRTVYMRYMHPMLLGTRVAHERLARICHGDYDREITLVAERQNPETNEREILGAARMTRQHGINEEARFSVLISDCCHDLGIGSELVHQLIQLARQEKIYRLEALMIPENEVMQHVFEKLGFQFSPFDEGKMLKAELVLL
jgi:acetyltransferase